MLPSQGLGTLVNELTTATCCGPVKGPEERHELGITWNKYNEQMYKYSIGKRVLNISLTAKVLGFSNELNTSVSDSEKCK